MPDWEADRIAVGLSGGEVMVLDEGAQVLSRWRVDPEGTLTLQLSEDGARLMTLDRSGEVELWATDTGERLARWRPPRGGHSEGAALRPDGGAVLFAQDGYLWLRPTDGGEATPLGPSQPTGNLGFWGDWAFGPGPEGQLTLWNASTGAAGPLLPALGPGWVAYPTQDGLLVSVPRAGVMRISNDVTRSERLVVPGYGQQPFAVARDGRRFTYIADGPAWSEALVTVDLNTGTPIQALAEPGDLIYGLAWSPKGRWIAVASGSALRLVEAPRLQAPPQPPFGVLPARLVGFDEEARHVVAVFVDGELYRWDVETGQEAPRRVLPLAADRGDRGIVDLHPDGSRLAYADPLGGLHLTTLSTGEDQVLGSATGAPYLRFGVDGSLVVADEQRLRTWDHKGEPVLDLELPRPERVAVGAQGLRLALSDTNGAVVVLHGPEAQVIASLPASECPAETLRFRLSEELIVVTRCGGVLLLDNEGRSHSLGELGDVNKAALDPYGEQLLLLHGAERMSRFDLNTGQDLGPIGERWPEPLGLRLERAALHPDRQRAVTSGDLGQVQLWDLETGDLLRTFTGSRPGGFAVAVDSAGVEVSSSHAGNLLLRSNGLTGDRLEERTLPAEVYALASSGDGALLAQGDGAGLVRLVNTRSGAVLSELQLFEQPVVELRFGPNNATLLARSEAGALVLLSRLGPTLTEQARAPEPVRGMAWSPNGRVLLVVERSGVLRSWDGQTWTELSTPRRLRYTGPIAWCPDGLVLAASSERDPDLVAVRQKSLGARSRPLYGGAPALNLACGGGYTAIAGTDGRLRVTRADGRLALLTRTDSTPIADLEMLPDGRVYTLNLSGQLRAWDPARSAILWQGGPEDSLGEPLPVQVIPRETVIEETIGIEEEEL